MYAGFERVQYQLRVFVEALAAFVLVDAQPFEFAASQAAAEPEDESPVGNVVEQRNLLGEAHGIVPRHHDHHRAELDVLGPSGDVGEHLARVRADGVIVEVMFGDPDGIEAERFRPLAIPEFFAQELPIGITAQMLKARSVADVHRLSLLRWPRARRQLSL